MGSTVSRAPIEPHLRIAFVGTYPPRRCGIATFTRDLAAGMRSADENVDPLVIAISEPGSEYEYPGEVEYELHQGTKGNYARAAELVNYKAVRWVSLQHEYGIFGGDDGAYILDFLSALRLPALVTLHTVLDKPSPSQRSIVQKMAKAAGLVVMSRVAADLLARRYDLAGAHIEIVPHGIPDFAPRDQDALKARFGVGGRRMLLTFGLLGPNKGVETVIRALPAIVAAFPNSIYFVVGATHPAVVREQGEAYRTSLERLAERLGVRDHVVFRDQYVTTDELCSYLQATDVFVSPYLSEAQVTSGALSYAMGAGAAAVSTPYWHAQELLADGRGRLFPFNDADSLAATITTLFSDPVELARLRELGYAHARNFTWSRVGEQYLRIGAALAGGSRRAHHRHQVPRASSLPELRLDHLLRMTDDTALVQHATFSVPARVSGYCVDDNARALIVGLQAELAGSADAKRLTSIYLAFLHNAQTSEGRFRNVMSYARCFADSTESEDCTGRALWALGTATLLSRDDGQRRLARQMFERGLPFATELGPRGTALTMLGLTAFLKAHPEVEPARELLGRLAQGLCRRYRDEETPGWRWFEPTLTYDNALVPLALWRAHALTGDSETRQVARETLDFLEATCFRGGRLSLVGNAGWHRRGGPRAEADEQPTDAAALVLAFHGAYVVSRDPRYLGRMRESFAWFLGANRLDAVVYDSTTAGCRDGLGATAPNLNQGAESTVSFLLALLEMLELAGEGLEYGGRTDGDA